MKLFMQQTFNLAEILYVCLPVQAPITLIDHYFSLSVHAYLDDCGIYSECLLWGEMKKMLRIMKAVECLKKVIV